MNDVAARAISGKFEVKPSIAGARAAVQRLLASLGSEKTTSDVAWKIADGFLDVVGASSVRLFVADEDGKHLRLEASHNLDHALRERLATTDVNGDSPAARAVRTRIAHFVDARHAPTYGPSSGASGVARTRAPLVAAIPLIGGDRVLGAVSATVRPLTTAERNELAALAEPLGAHLERAELRAERDAQREHARAREDFLAVVAHELRQPLNVILVNATLAARRELDGRVAAELRHVTSSARQLNQLIADLTDATLLDAGRLPLARTSAKLSLLVVEAIARYAKRPEAVQFARGTDDDTVDVDPRRIEQVLANLLDNAEKYGRATGVTKVELARDGEEAIVTVTTHGGEIPTAHHASIFERYHRAADAHDKPGLGIGLYVCKRLVEAHGGRIWVESGDGRTCFGFALPASS